MEHLKMQTADQAEENFKKLVALFPNAVTEIKNGNGEIIRAIDADVLRREVSAPVVEGSRERYQFTWPDKNKTIYQAGQKTDKTLRLIREKSVGKDGTPGSIDTENIYIEGDNLEALKILRETYLGKVKMIYIDPPYNTGHDFIYYDDFSKDTNEYNQISGQYDEKGGRLVQHLESNGRFHTDWLNMIYPRLKIARDFLSNDGVIFISIDDNEQANLKKICDEIFGAGNFIGDILWNSTKSVTNTALISVSHTYNLVYCKRIEYFVEHRTEFRLLESGDGFANPDNDPRGVWKADPFQVGGWRPNQQYEIINPKTGKKYKPNPGCSWKNDYVHFQDLLKDNRIVFGINGEGGPQRKRFLFEAQERGKVTKTWWDDVDTTTNATQQLKKFFDNNTVFSNPKPIDLIIKFMQLATKSDSIVMDFFSGSATTAHAVMKLNAEDEGKRKFILVQIPEETPENSEARKAGYQTICEIGEERIRRAAAKIRQEYPVAAENLDLGFRVFRVDSSNMKEVFYRPDEFQQNQLEFLADNIKEDRTPEDLLFQVMPEFDIPLSAEIEEEIINGKKVFTVSEGYLIACFDSDITEETVKAIALRKPDYAAFRDSGMSSDSVITNFEQIFETYSPETTRKIL